jgi:phosphotransferase system  glucose/maltose/N-acetylglucosamine-specific IIC component
VGSSFPNHELMILLALIFLALAIGVPAWKSRGGKGCLLAVLGFVAVIGTLFALIALWEWVSQNVGREGGRFTDRLWRVVGHLFRFLFGGFLGMLIAAPIVLPKHLGPLWENLGMLTGILVLACASVWVRIRLGTERYRRLVLGFLGTMAVSWVLALLSLLLPWPYALDVAVLVPLLLYVALAVWVRPGKDKEGM